MRHKIITGILIIFVILIITGNNAIQKSSENSSATIKQETTQKEIIPEPELIELSGTGQQSSQVFNLEKGLTVFKMTHTGTSNFSIVLMDSNGERVKLLVNEIGQFDGAKAVGILKKGNYILDISASGIWTVEIKQPRPTSADAKPKTFTGTSQQVSPFINLDKGLTTFNLNHNGNSNFSVTLMDKNGKRIELLVNEIGQFDGSKAVGISRAGLYLMDISASGDWSIDIQ